MNPRSGGGKVAKFRLEDKAAALGAEVTLLEGPGVVDVAALAREAVDDGADLLGVAGGDGTQALVAGIAAERDIPMMVISAGTRNHFALDLGLDRDDPASCLDALTDGVELRIDLGLIGDRTFVNNASFGAYAEVVQSPAYRDDKTGTTLDMLPDLLTGHQGAHLGSGAWRGDPRLAAGHAGEQQPLRDRRHRRPRPAGPGSTRECSACSASGSRTPLMAAMLAAAPFPRSRAAAREVIIDADRRRSRSGSTARP